MTSMKYVAHSIVINFCVRLIKTPIQTHEMLQIVRSKSPIAYALNFEWHKCFGDG